MKKTYTKIRTLVALLMAGAAFAACSSNDDNIIEQKPVQNGKQVYTLTINASKGGTGTRALDINGSGGLTASWDVGDKLTVYNVTKDATLTGNLTASSASGGTAIFSGSLTGTIENGDELRLTYHPTKFDDFGDQDGTLKGPNGAEKYDQASATVTVKTVDGSNNITTTGDANFTTETAMVKFTLTDGTNRINATKLEVKATVNVQSQNLELDMFTFTIPTSTYTTNGDGVLYFAMPSVDVLIPALTDIAKLILPMVDKTVITAGISSKIGTSTITFTATAGGNTYTVEKMGYKFDVGKYYNNVTLTMALPTLTISSPTVEQVIGSDGKNYNYANLPKGVTAVARICYVDGNNGLALALTDESGVMTWSTAETTVAAHTPAFNGSEWKLATRDGWNNMKDAVGGADALRDGFTSVGGENMGSGANDYFYWSSTENLNYSNYMYACCFKDNNIYWISGNGGSTYNHVRSALAF